MMCVKIWKTTGMIKVSGKIINPWPRMFNHPSIQEDVPNTRCECMPGTKLGAGDSQGEMTGRMFSTHSSLSRIRWLASSLPSCRKSVPISKPWLLSSIKVEMEWEFGVIGCTLWHVEWTNNRILLYNTGSYLQYPMTNHNGEECEEECMYMCNWSTLWCSRNQHNILNQLHSSQK